MQWLTSVFYPKLLSVLKEGYTRDQFIKDVSAGTIAFLYDLWNHKYQLSLLKSKSSSLKAFLNDWTVWAKVKFLRIRVLM